MIMHRLKRLIGSFYHQKRIDIIITGNVHYVRNDGTWESSDTPQKMIVFADTKVIRPASATTNPVLYSQSDLQTLAKKHGVTGNLNNPCVSALNANTSLRVNSLIGFAL